MPLITRAVNAVRGLGRAGPPVASAPALEPAVEQPFAGLAGSFEDLSVQLDAVATDAGTLAAEVEELEPDLRAVAADLHAVETSVSALATRVEAFGAIRKVPPKCLALAITSMRCGALVRVRAAESIAISVPTYDPS